MLQQTNWSRLFVVVLISLIVLLPEPVQAARRFAFDANLAEIRQICQDGISFLFANDGRNPLDNGVGMQGRIRVYHQNGSLLGERQLTMSLNVAPLDSFFVYAAGQILWTELPEGAYISVELALLDRGGNLVKSFAPDSFIVTNCSLTQAIPSHFTYQGQLMDSNVPANNQYDFRFRLYDAQAGGQQIGVDYPASAVSVTNGQFSITPAFGLAAFDGTPRWLEVAVKPLNADPSAYTTLTPRQQIVAVPYALQSLSVPNHSHLGERWLGNWPLLIQGSFHSPDFTIMSPYANETVLSNFGFAVDNVHPLGSGLLSAAVGQVALYGYNRGLVTDSGIAVFGFSENGQGGVFATRNGTNILAGYHYTNDQWQARFRVDQVGNMANNGDIFASGYIYATNFYCHTVCSYRTNAATFAEMLPAQVGLEAGDVLVIGTDGQLTRSTTPNATGVAGIYSAQPGFIGGYTIPQESFVSTLADENEPLVSDKEIGKASDVALSAEARQRWLAEQEAAANAGKIPLAIIGVMPVKVSAENGPIVPGDLLTTASLPGHAMKATPVDVGGVSIYRPGTIVGKALEGLAGGSGIIRVLVTLQ